MKKTILICALLMITALFGAAAAATAQITVTGYTLDPTQLINGDTGIVGVTVKNTGTSVVTIHTADLESPLAGIRILNDMTYDSVGNIGPGDSQTFTFTYTADVPDGTYYLKLYLDLSEAGSYRQYIPVTVKSTDLVATIADVPASFSEGKKSSITVNVGNPRGNTVNGVTITPIGTGITVSPKKAFIGELAPDSTGEATFEITPQKETNLEFLVEYHNGINDHNTSVTQPVTFTGDKLESEPVVNNIKITESGQTSTITGDVTNAGLSNAMSVVVTVGSPAQPVDPNRLYVIGELKPDDFASFEVTYTVQQSVTTIPLVIQHKDSDGNVYTTTFNVSRSSGSIIMQNQAGTGSSGSTAASASGNQAMGGPPGGGPGGGLFGIGSFGSGMGAIPWGEIGIIVAFLVLVTAVIIKKGYIKKLATRMPRRKRIEDDDEFPDG
jgi:hypothetical protein